MGIRRDPKQIERLNDARALVREVLKTDLGQSVSNKKINEAADKILAALPEASDPEDKLTA